MAEPATDTLDPTSETPKLRLLNPRDVRRDAEIDVDLGDGTMVRARKLDGRGAGGAGRGLATVEADAAKTGTAEGDVAVRERDGSCSLVGDR